MFLYSVTLGLIAKEGRHFQRQRVKHSFCLEERKTTPVQLRTGAVENVCKLWYNKDKKKFLPGNKNFAFHLFNF